MSNFTVLLMLLLMKLRENLTEIKFVNAGLNLIYTISTVKQFFIMSVLRIFWGRGIKTLKRLNRSALGTPENLIQDPFEMQHHFNLNFMFLRNNLIWL